jgi:CO/xanthine dehydrogenase Mo-binding subunit
MVGGCNSMLRWAYKCADAKFRGFSVVTNKPRVGYWRCVYDPQSLYVMGIVTDMMAEKLGKSPLEFRRKNLVEPDLPDQDSGNPYASNAVRECLEEVATASGFSTKWHAPNTETMADGRMHGIGISAHVDTHGSLSGPVGAIVNLTRDGKALILSGISRAGGGTNTAHAHIVAETLGMNYDDVLTGDWGNTDVCSDGGGQGGSTRTITTGAAMQMAAEDARDQAFVTAADMLGVPANQIEASEGKVFEVGNETNFKTWAEVSAKTRGQLVGRGYTWAKELRRAVAGFAVGTPCEVRGTQGSAVEVAVDTETGEVEILNFYSADDMGRAIFYKGAENQIEGGIEIQLQEAFYVQQELDALTGITLNANLLDHKFPTTLDLHQDRHHAIIVEPDDACGPYGCKGMGEPTVCGYGAVAQAIYNAVGVWIGDPPITAQKILKALGKA